MSDLCNRVLLLRDETIRCEKPLGHDGLHSMDLSDEDHGHVEIRFEKGIRLVNMQKLQHIIPHGQYCVREGVACPFLARQTRDKNSIGFPMVYACYLSGGGIGTSVYPHDNGWKGCSNG